MGEDSSIPHIAEFSQDGLGFGFLFLCVSCNK